MYEQQKVLSNRQSQVQLELRVQLDDIIEATRPTGLSVTTSFNSY